MQRYGERFGVITGAKKWLVCVIIVFTFATAHAFDSSPSHRHNTQTQASQLSELNPSKTIFNRAQWKLSDEEWTRYQKLLRGIRGSLSPKTLSPVEVLGIHARNDAERRRFAQRWAKMMRNDTERVLAFQRAYDVAWKALNPSGLLIDVSQIERLNKVPVLRPGDRLLFFTRLDDCPDCEIALSHVTRAAKTNDVQLDIYLIGTKAKKDDPAIKRWAKKQTFDPARLKTKKITFNHDNGTLHRLAGIKATAPKILRIRGKDVTVVELSQL